MSERGATDTLPERGATPDMNLDLDHVHLPGASLDAVDTPQHPVQHGHLDAPTTLDRSAAEADSPSRSIGVAIPVIVLGLALAAVLVILGTSGAEESALTEQEDVDAALAKAEEQLSASQGRIDEAESERVRIEDLEQSVLDAYAVTFTSVDGLLGDLDAMLDTQAESRAAEFNALGKSANGRYVELAEQATASAAALATYRSALRERVALEAESDISSGALEPRTVPTLPTTTRPASSDATSVTAADDGT